MLDIPTITSQESQNSITLNKYKKKLSETLKETMKPVYEELSEFVTLQH
jgi:hypothetical protein